MLVSACVLAACSASKRDQEAEIFVETTPPGAGCILLRAGQPIAQIERTPGIAVVTRSPQDIAIECTRSGFQAAAALARSRQQPATFGSFFAGGPGYDYDGNIGLALVPNGQASPRPEQLLPPRS